MSASNFQKQLTPTIFPNILTKAEVVEWWKARDTRAKGRRFESTLYRGYSNMAWGSNNLSPGVDEGLQPKNYSPSGLGAE